MTTSSTKSQIISSVIAFAIVALLSSFAGFRVVIVGAVIFASLVARLLTESAFARLINKTVTLTWMYWVWFALYLIGIIFLFVTAKTGSNICAWITIALFIAGLIFQIIDVKSITPKKEEVK